MMVERGRIYGAHTNGVTTKKGITMFDVLSGAIGRIIAFFLVLGFVLIVLDVLVR